MSTFVDQVGRSIEIAAKPIRIISTVPSQTELLYDLGLQEYVVGITAYCVHPKHWLAEKMVIGGTKDLQIEKIKNLNPDLIIGNKEENIKEQIEALSSVCPVWLSDVETIEGALEMVTQLGAICQVEDKAATLRADIEKARQELAAKKLPKKRAAYFIWKNPYMLAGSDSFISRMMAECRFENVIAEKRYPEMTLVALKELKPDLLLLSSEPYSFTTKDLQEIAEQVNPTQSKIVDGEMFSWYGSRMAKAFRFFARIF